MSTPVQTYTDELLLALRLRELPGTQIAEALAEVNGHVAETGEDPREAFGPPRAYARQIAEALGEPGEPPALCRSLLTWSTAAYGLGGAAGAWLTSNGVLALASGRQSALSLSPWVPLLLGLSVLIVLAVGLRHLARDKDVPVLDPLTGQDMTAPLPRWVLPATIAPPALALVLAAVLGLAQR